MYNIIKHYKNKLVFKKYNYIRPIVKQLVFEDPNQQEDIKHLRVEVLPEYSYICKVLKKYEEPFVPEKTHFISFHTEGPPYDEGIDFTKYRELTNKKASEHFDNVFIYTPQILSELGYDRYLKMYEPTPMLGACANYIGLSSYRPAMMLHELSKMNDGDLLVHRDINYEKYPVYKHFDNIVNIALECLEKCGSDFFVPFHDQYMENYDTVRLVHQTKTNVIRELGEDHPFSYEFPQVQASIFIMRKSPETIEILTEWKTAMDNEEWLDGKQYGEMDPRFSGWTLIDNALLSMVIANRIRKNKLPERYPGLYFTDRDIHKLHEWTNWDHLQFKSFITY
jgi:hypothetical protein